MDILVDYLTISYKAISLDKTLELLKLNREEMQEIKSYYGMEKCLYMGGIKVHYGEYIILDMSGQGCRMLESLCDKQLNWVDFINIFLREEGSHLARLDIACDDKPGENEKALLSFGRMVNHLKHHKYIAKAQRMINISGSEENIIFGATTSDRRLRIYNKALERGCAGHWIRAEFQLRDKAALSFYMRAFESGSIGATYQGMLIDYLRFTTQKNNDDDHQSRLRTAPWWLKFCGNAQKIKGFYVGGLEYNMQQLTHFIKFQASSSIKAFVLMKGGDISQLMDMAGESTLNKKQQFLVDVQPLIQQMRKDYK